MINEDWTPEIFSAIEFSEDGFKKVLEDVKNSGFRPLPVLALIDGKPTWVFTESRFITDEWQKVSLERQKRSKLKKLWQ